MKKLIVISCLLLAVMGCHRQPHVILPEAEPNISLVSEFVRPVQVDKQVVQKYGVLVSSSKIDTFQAWVVPSSIVKANGEKLTLENNEILAGNDAKNYFYANGASESYDKTIKAMVYRKQDLYSFNRAFVEQGFASFGAMGSVRMYITQAQFKNPLSKEEKGSEILCAGSKVPMLSISFETRMLKSLSEQNKMEISTKNIVLNDIFIYPGVTLIIMGGEVNKSIAVDAKGFLKPGKYTNGEGSVWLLSAVE